MSALLIVVPLLGILALNLPLKFFTKALAFWLCAAVCILQGVLALNPDSSFWSQPAEGLLSLLVFRPAVDNISFVMFLAIAIVAMSSLFVSQSAIKENGRFTFINLLLLLIIGMNGVVLANDLFTLYIFLEVTAVASFILIAFEKGKNAFEGAFKYVVLSAVASALILASLAILLMVSGGLGFNEVRDALLSSSHSKIAILAVAVFVVGLFIKGGLVPFHGWLPDAYSSAPSPVSVVLAGIVTKATGVYTLVRLVISVFGFSEPVKLMLLLIGTISIVVGALAALGQSDFKRMLSYSSISQVGYIILGLGAGTELAIAGAVFHLFNHAIFKSLLFVNAAAVEEQTGTRNMDKLGGIASKMPVTGTTSVVAFLSTAGIPPLSGFWSKLIIIVAVWKAGFHGYAAIAILASLLTLAYFLSMQRRVFFGKLADGFAGLKEAGPWIIIPALILMLITVGLGLGFPWLFGTFLMPVGSIL